MIKPPHPTRLLVFLFLACLPALLPAQPLPELNDRIQRSVERLTDQDRQPAFTRDFLLADVRLNPTDPRRFYNFSGDLSGRYLEVIALLPRAERGTVDLPDLVRGIVAEQRPDGRFGDAELDFVAGPIGGEHMALLWGNGRMLVGLMTYYATSGDERALTAARRLGDFFIGTAEACRRPATVEQLKSFGAKGIICFTQYIEGLALLARATGDDRYLQAAADNYDVLPERGKQHSHGYLSTLRGVLLLYEQSRNPDHLAYVRTQFDDLLASEDHNRYGAVFEYFGGKEDASDAGHSGERDEGCSSADFARLALHLYRVTGEENYRAAGLNATYNALLYNQYASGDFGHHYYDDGVLRASNPRRSWWCCTMHGLRALLALRDEFTLDTRGRTVTLDHLLPQHYVDENHAFTLTLTSVSPEAVAYELRVERWEDDRPLTVRAPHWGSAWTLPTAVRLEAGGTYEITGKPGLTLFTPDDEPLAEFPAQPRAGYLRYGPYLLGINQETFVAEPDWANQVDLSTLRADADIPFALRARFRHGGYPGEHDVVLVPYARQLATSHGYMRLVTGYGMRVVPVSPDR